MVYPRTLFARTGLTVAAALLAMLLFAATVVSYSVLVPMARQAAEDLAALIVLSAQTWVELPPDTRTDFEAEVREHHGLQFLANPADAAPPTERANPYLRYFRQALAHRLELDLPVLEKPGDADWLWVDIPIANRILRLGFPTERAGPQLPIPLVLLLAGTTLVTLITTLFLVRRITHPMETLSQAIRRVGKGQQMAPLPEQGPEEFAILAKRFNTMTAQIRDLLTHRTTLLAGISHDLRTPIARMHLELEMLADKPDPALISGLRKDLTEMESLISRVLEMAKGLDGGQSERQRIDLVALLQALTAEYDNEEPSIRLQVPRSCGTDVNAASLKRVLSNLIENAMRYGGTRPIAVRLTCDAETVIIEVADQGPGIPEDQREAVFLPFHRLEQSRNPATGGSGLGLAIVRQLCDAQGWGIALESNQPTGTLVRLTISRSVGTTGGA